MTRPKSPFQRPIIDERVQQRARGGGRGRQAWAVATLQTMTRYYFIIYGTNFAVAGRRFSDSAPLEARIKLPSVGWIKTLITSGDIYWTAFAGVRTGSRAPSAFQPSTLSRVCFSVFLLLRSRSTPPSLPTFGTNFCRSAVVSNAGGATIVSQTTVLTTFMREISSLARQITPLRLSLNLACFSLPDTFNPYFFRILGIKRFWDGQKPWYLIAQDIFMSHKCRIIERLISLHG